MIYYYNYSKRKNLKFTLATIHFPTTFYDSSTQTNNLPYCGPSRCDSSFRTPYQIVSSTIATTTYLNNSESLCQEEILLKLFDGKRL